MSILEMQMWVYNPKYKKYISERGNVVMEKEIIGRQIKELRIYANMTLEQLAEIMDVSKRTLQRYESGEATPDMRVLTKLVDLFGFSADYFIGKEKLNGVVARTRASKKKNLRFRTDFWGNYNRAKTEYTIDKDADYYYITLGESWDGEYGLRGMTMWTGFTDEKDDIRELMPVNPERILEDGTEDDIMVLNSGEDVAAFIGYGGTALVREDICNKYLPWVMKPIIIKWENVDRIPVLDDVEYLNNSDII